mmetsp:Transcript_17959/g.35829  ORF Transcript_17959/g.35829 Transcript_17959/m.35829 type:complete len:248 (-) Transcript_17959:447-1190(-)
MFANLRNQLAVAVLLFATRTFVETALCRNYSGPRANRYSLSRCRYEDLFVAARILARRCHRSADVARTAAIIPDQPEAHVAHIAAGSDVGGGVVAQRNQGVPLADRDTLRVLADGGRGGGRRRGSETRDGRGRRRRACAARHGAPLVDLLADVLPARTRFLAPIIGAEGRPRAQPHELFVHVEQNAVTLVRTVGLRRSSRGRRGRDCCGQPSRREEQSRRCCGRDSGRFCQQYRRFCWKYSRRLCWG